jgi:hypothetical protein
MFKNFKIGRKIGIGLVAGISVIVVLGIITYRTTHELIENSRMQTHTYEVLTELNDVTAEIQNAEIGQRGYIITGQQRSLESYRTTLPTIQKKLNNLRELTADNPNQQQRLNILEPAIAQRIAIINNRINVRTREGFEAARKLILTDSGRELTDKINRVIEEAKLEENQLLENRSRQTDKSTRRATNTIIFSIPLSILLLSLIGFYLNRIISRPLQNIAGKTLQLANGDLSVNISDYKRRDEIGMLAQAFNQMVINLRETTEKNNEQNWLKSNVAKFTQVLQGHRNLHTVSRIIISELAPLVEAQLGIVYIMDIEDEQPILKLTGSYAYQERKHLSNRFHLGEGLVGQCALEKQKIILTDVPSDYIRIASGLGEIKPFNIIVLPVIFENEVKAVIELASLQRFREIQLTFLDEVTEIIAVILNAIAADIRTQQLLEESQTLTQQLQSQQQELQESNQLLQQQAKNLQVSEELLRQQQGELQQSNEELHQLNAELEEKAELLAIQKKEVDLKNSQLEQTRLSLEEKASELALSSKYKSEFLANMSHELRTPLNSLLILAKLLTDNTNGNLTEKQVEYSQTIYSAGTDLLSLINDILDLAKIESGTISLELHSLLLTELKESLQRTFQELAQEKGVNFVVEFSPDLPKTIYTDPKRLQQILKNLLSNAFKFTEQGEVRLKVDVATGGWSYYQEKLNQASSAIAFAVSDTGIGIAAEKQKLIFEAFQQADGSTSRKYGGTGLGLSISREIANLLGGEITLSSRLGEGSIFTLYIPEEREEEKKEVEEVKIEELMLTSSVPDDRNFIKPNSSVLLIIEDDVNFARILLDMAREAGFKCILAQNGNSGLALARQFQPLAILLDIQLPGMDGWTVLDILKHDTKTRHIPIHIMTVDEGRQRSLQQGAIAYLQKPVTVDNISEALTKIKGFVERRVKNLLVVEDDAIQRQSIVELIGDGDVATTAVATGAQALAAIQQQYFDCMVLDLGLPDMSGFELIKLIKQEPNGDLPIIVYTGRDITKAQETELRRMAETIILKDVRSPERLLDETALFLHRIQANLPAPKQQILAQLQSSDPILTSKKVLIVDDDVRNIFALTSLLEGYQMQVLYAENGKDGISVLENNPDINIILMDIMMPEMDGYETTQLIRTNQQFKSLPIIALTAKAMQGDREKCIQAGASDYITKPVDTEQLISLLRVWLYK